MYWVLFPFEESNDAKVRPGIVIDVSPDELEVLTVKVSRSQSDKEILVAIEHWLQAGLREPSFAIVSKIRLLKKDRFSGFIGTIHRDDLLDVLEAAYKNEFL
ncbi:type II toxin-antitoxin system PemK/MazF family toxin [Paenibacillus algorifonticola]|uniref:type II toxin-antitoxin system PemK/MazF family toxin n=1 Tax=Paenibacillus algorifonticola TaxID=684063 RepID=UPI003D27D80C